MKKTHQMEINQRYPMEKSVKIMRRSVYVFLQNYHYFTTIAAVLALPLAALALIADSSFPLFPLFRAVFSRLMSLFDAVGFPRSSDFFSFLSLKLSQTIATSFVVIPFTLTFLLLAKSYVIQVLSNRKSFFSIYKSLFVTQICNILIIFSANATCICVVFLIFSCIDGLGLWTANSLLIFTAIGGVLYSIILANALVICNLALTLSGMENRGGFLAILKACVLIKGRTSTALSLALPVHILYASVEALFHYRIIRANYLRFESPLYLSIALEGLLIVYMYSILLVLDSVISCIFYKSCNAATRDDHQGRSSCWIEIEEKDEENSYLVLLNTLDDLP